MELLLNEPFNINEYCEQMVVTYLAEDAPLLTELFDRLDHGGYEYIKNELAYYTVIKNSYVTELSRYLPNCGCYLLLLSNSFLSEKNRALRNHIWYQIGHMQSQDKDVVIPLCLDDSNISLGSTPLQQYNIVRSVDEAMATVTKKFRKAVAKSSFFDDIETNRYVNLRLDYRKLVIQFEITEESFANAKEEYCDILGEGDIDDSDFEKILRKDISLSCMLLSFGSEQRLTAQLIPYRSEMYFTPTEYPRSFTCKKLYVNKRGFGDVVAEYLFELVLPIHRLFGVNFKPCLKGTGEVEASVLERLFETNFEPKHDLHVKGNSLYFSLAFPKAKHYDIDPSLGVGTEGDYLFPQ